MKRLTRQSAVTSPQMWLTLARISLVIMEITLYSLWYQGLFKTVSLPFPALSGLLAAVLVVSYGLARTMGTWDARLLVRQALFLAWSGLAIYGTMRVMIFAGIEISLREMVYQPVQFITLEESEGASFFHILVILLIIWRGVALAGMQVSVWKVQIAFQLGLLGLFIYGIALAPGHPVEAITGMFLYLFFALVSMSAARIASLGEMREGRVPRFSAGWLAGILFTGLGVVALALLAGWLASSRVVAWLIQAFVLILTLITTLLMLLLNPVLTILARALTGLMNLLEQLSKQAAAVRLPKLLEDLVIEFASIIEKILPGAVAGRGILMTAMLILLLLAVLFGLRIRIRQLNLREEEGGDSADGRENNLWHRFIQRIAPNLANLRLRSPGQLFAAARVRQIYRQLMSLSQKLGAGRPPSLTPLEFLPQLAALFPGQQEGLDQITSAYVKVRYGEYPETLREVEEVQRAWDQIRRQARKKNAVPKKD